MDHITRTEYSARNTAVALVSRIIAILMGYAVRVVFTAVLSTSYVGVSGLFTDIINVLSLSELGIETAITYALYSPVAFGDIEKQKSVMALYRRLYRIVALLVTAFGLALIPFMGIIISDPGDVTDLTLIYILYLAGAVVSYFFIYRKTLMDASQIRYVGVACHTVFLVIQDVLQIVILITTGNFILFLCIGLLATIGYNVTTSLLATRKYPYLKDRNVTPLPKEEKDDIFKNIGAMLMHKVGNVVVNNTDNILLSAMTGLVNAGIYANNFLVFASIRQLLNEVFDSITASVGNLSVTEDEERAGRIFDCAFFVGQWMFGLASICIFMLLPSFSFLSFGKTYAYEYWPMLVIAINFYVTGMRRATIVYRDACGLFYYDRYKAVAEALINIVELVLLTMKFGFIGVFLGTFVATMTTSFWVEPFVLYKYKLHTPLWGYFKKYFLYSLVFGVCLFLTDYLSRYCEGLLGIGNDKLLILLVFRLFFCVIFVDLFYLVCFFKKKEFALVVEKAKFLYNKKRG